MSAPRRSYPFFNAVLLSEDRYVLRDATMLDLVATAYALDRSRVQAGPPWLELDRFDILTKVPAGTTKAGAALLLKALLAERFHLVLHDSSRPLPAYILTATPDAPSKLKPGTGDTACDFQSNVGKPARNHLICHNTSLEGLADQLHNFAGDYLDKPLINSTKLDAQYDFELSWTFQLGLTKPDTLSLPDALAAQLGLKYTVETAPRPVVLIDSVAETPTPNVAGVEKLVAPSTPLRFDVATIKPAQPGERSNGSILPGGTVNFTNIPMKIMVDLAWDLNEDSGSAIANAPKWLEDDHFDILAKAAHENTGIAAATNLPMDIYDVQIMLQNLIIERFHMKAHMEDRPSDGFTLLPGTPRFKPAADPTARALCKDGPGLDGKDPRIATPVLDRLIFCQNVTMPQFADELYRVASGYVHGPILDATGLKGSYDITLNFTRSSHFNAANPGAQPAEPDGALTLSEAVSRQLGLKLEKQKRPMPVLVIDHIEEKPEEN